MEYVTYEEFKKMDIRLGTIIEVEVVPETDKLLRCMIDFNENETMEEKDEEGNIIESKTVKKLRQIVSGIHEYYPNPQVLVGKQILYIVNLEPRTIKGVESNGMLMAVDGEDGKPVLLVPEVPVGVGSRVR